MSKQARCRVCGYVYDEKNGDPKSGVRPGTVWEELPDDWVCPVCGAGKSEFEILDSTPTKKTSPKPRRPKASEENDEPSATALAALCSNLAKGCEKQVRESEAVLFRTLAGYYESIETRSDADSVETVRADLREDLDERFPSARAAATERKDRGALRVLTWTEKATAVLGSVLDRYQKEGDRLPENTKIFVCEICGFVYIGDAPPEICPICKVPNLKINEVKE